MLVFDVLDVDSQVKIKLLMLFILEKLHRIKMFIKNIITKIFFCIFSYFLLYKIKNITKQLNIEKM